MCQICEHVPPLELPAEGVYLLDAGRLSFIGNDMVSISSALRCTMPARGYMVIHKRSGHWSARRIDVDTLDAARAVASDMGMHSVDPVVLGEVARMGGDPLAPTFLVAAVSVFEPITKGELLRQAIESADDVIDSLRVLRPVEKAGKKDPFTKVGFDQYAEDMAKALERSIGDMPQMAINDIVNKAGFDLASATEAQIIEFAHRMNAAMVKAVGAPEWASMHGVLETHTEKLVKNTVQVVVDKYSLGMSTKLDKKDMEAIRRSSIANTTFVRQTYQGTICPRSSAKAREIIRSGMDEGLGSRAIGANIKDGVGKYVTNQNRDYFNVVSDAAVARAREYSSIRRYSEAGVSIVIISSVLDERTTETCRYLDGMVLEVEHCMQKYAEMDSAKDPNEVKWRMPWLREGTIKSGDDAGKRGIFIAQEKGWRQVATVEKPAFGTWDKGAYRGLGGREMVEVGMGPPPYHGHCRTTTVPDVSYNPSVVVEPRVTSPQPKPAKQPPIKTVTKPIAPPPVPRAPKSMPPVAKPTVPNKPVTAPPSQPKPSPPEGGAEFNPRALANALSSKVPNKAEQTVIREQVRALLREQGGMQSFDVYKKRGGANKYAPHTFSDKVDIPGVTQKFIVNASHAWDGRVKASAATHKGAAEFIDLVDKRGVEYAMSRPGLANAFRTLIHEEIHGCSRTSSATYKGIGLLVEEVSTEAAARQIMRQKFGFKWSESRAYTEFMDGSTSLVRNAFMNTHINDKRLGAPRINEALGKAGMAIRKDPTGTVISTPKSLMRAYSEEIAKELADESGLTGAKLEAFTKKLSKNIQDGFTEWEERMTKK